MCARARWVWKLSLPSSFSGRLDPHSPCYPVEAQAPDGDWLKPQMRWHTTGTEFHHAPVFVSWLVMPIRARAAAEAKGS